MYVNHQHVQSCVWSLWNRFIWQMLKSLSHNPDLMILKKKPFENIVGKGENAGNRQCFLPNPKRISTFNLHFILSSAKAFNLD